jgi:hypothetical protein
MRGREKAALIVIVIVVLTIMIFCGCTKKIVEQSTSNSEITSTESIKIDTIYIPMPADTTYIQMPADCPDQQTIVKDGGKEISVVIKDKIIYIKRITPADSIAIYNTLFKKNVKEVKQEIKVVEKTAFKTPKFMIWLLIVSISINILFVLYYGLKKRFMIG